MNRRVCRNTPVFPLLLYLTAKKEKFTSCPDCVTLFTTIVILVRTNMRMSGAKVTLNLELTD